MLSSQFRPGVACRHFLQHKETEMNAPHGFYMTQANSCSAMADSCGDFMLKEKWLRLAIEWLALEAEEILSVPIELIPIAA